MFRTSLVGVLLWSLLVAPAHADEAWKDLFANGPDAFCGKISGWVATKAISLDAAKPRLFQPSTEPGDIWCNGPKGNATNLFTKKNYGDVEVRTEFMMTKGSNSGIKFHGHYELQICDSYGKKNVDGNDCEGVYPRAELKPSYHHIDKGIAPKSNACKAPGEWQRLEAVFLAPRFDADGKKTADAKLVRVALNGQLIHENQELKTPTGDRWQNAEMKEGPIMLQADHGPVAFRNVKVRTVPKATQK